MYKRFRDMLRVRMMRDTVRRAEQNWLTLPMLTPCGLFLPLVFVFGCAQENAAGGDAVAAPADSESAETQLAADGDATADANGVLDTAGGQDALTDAGGDLTIVPDMSLDDGGIAESGCTAAATCNDDNNCTTDDCVGGTCTHKATAGEICDDGEPCTDADKCSGKGVCIGGPDTDCDDANPCTDDSCKLGYGCVHKPVTGVCDGGNACTTTVCDDQNPCTLDTCDPATGKCKFDATVLVGNGCDDNDPCTYDGCSAGGCVHSGPLCSYGACLKDPDCANGVCDPQKNACVACTAAKGCSAGMACIDGGCESAVPCAGDAACKAAGKVCNLKLGVCVDCNLESDCGTTELCLGNKCYATTACTTSKQCSGTKVCELTTKVCVDCLADGDCPASSYCSSDHRCLPDLCTSFDCAGSVAAGCSVSGSAYVIGSCDDGNACTDDSCVSLACQHVNNTAGCDDGNLCTPGDTCSAGVCAGATPVCGTGTCDCGETFANCPADCAPAGMVLIPAGTFWMGCNAAKDNQCAADESPQHKLTLSAYYMDVTETTVAQYKACVDAGVCTAPGSVQPAQYATYPGLTTNPVNYVSWTQSQAYCKWRGAAFDLPTEAQWEMAARGSCEKNGSTAGDAGCAAAMRTYPWGEATASCIYAVMSEGTKDGCGTKATWAVGSKTAGDSPYGLHDMAGNVHEWNRDWYGTYSAGAVTDPVGPASASTRVLRDGSFVSITAVSLRAGGRNNATPSDAFFNVGLRCMRSYP